jgi:exportin-T
MRNLLFFSREDVVSFSHVAVQRYYFEIIFRYVRFFEIRVDLIPQVLGPFLDERGMYHRDGKVHSRVWYLFNRFVKSLGTKLLAYVDSILSRMAVRIRLSFFFFFFFR